MKHLVRLLAIACTAALTAQMQFVDVSSGLLPPDSDLTNAVASGDFDGDGSEDLVWAYFGGAKLLLNDGSGRFRVAVSSGLPSGPLDMLLSVRTGDVDGDGDLDVLFLDTQKLRLFLNTNARFAETFALPRQSGFPFSAAFVDVDIDRDLDIVLTTDGGVRLWKNDGKGTYGDSTLGNIPSVPSTLQLAVARVNADPFPDLVVSAGRTLRYFEGRGAGRYVDLTATHLPRYSAQAGGLALGDIDGDGDRDLFVGNIYSPDNLWVNDGKGRFRDASSQLPRPERALTNQAALVDLDGDADLDLLIAKSTLGALQERQRMYLNDGRGTFSDATATRLPLLPASNNLAFALVDVDSDGDVDIAAPGNGAQDRLLINRQRDIRATTPARIGRLFAMEVWGHAGYATQVRAAVPFIGLLAAKPRIKLPPFGSLGIAPAALVLGPPLQLGAPSGKGDLRFTIPALSGLLNLPLYGQALILHEASAATWRFSNTSLDRIRP